MVVKLLLLKSLDLIGRYVEERSRLERVSAFTTKGQVDTCNWTLM